MQRHQHPLQPVLVHEQDRPREQGEEVRLGRATWRTLLSGDTTPSLFMTCGILEVGGRQGGDMSAHQHPQAEIYHVLEGEGIVTIEGQEYPVRQGTTLFIPGGWEHSTRSKGEPALKIFYVFAVDSFAEVNYSIAK